MNPLEHLARPFVVFVERFYPDAFVFAILLSVVAYLMAVGMTETSALEALDLWGLGLTGLLSFIAQLSLTLVCAHALAHTDPVKRVLKRIATWPRRSWQGYFLVSVVAGLGSLFAWSLGLVVGALIALEVAREGRSRGLVLHFPLLVASAYGGFVVWHMGYSSSAALFVATPGHSLESVIGLIPVRDTIFSTANVVLALVTVPVVAAVCAAMAPQSGAVGYEGTNEPDSCAVPGGGSLGERLENARIISALMGIGFLAFLVSWFAERGLNLTLDIVNWSFLGLGLLLARSPVHYVRLVGDASRAVGPIILQYPFYAGIMALMTQTDLVNIISGWFVTIASAETLGFWAFIAGGVLNFFIPSGGGQWAVQGPIFIEAARQLDVAAPVIVLAVAYGDQWTNMIQPFWTLPMLAIVGLGMRAIMGYCFVVFLATFVLFGGALLLTGAG